MTCKCVIARKKKHQSPRSDYRSEAADCLIYAGTPCFCLALCSPASVCLLSLRLHPSPESFFLISFPKLSFILSSRKVRQAFDDLFDQLCYSISFLTEASMEPLFTQIRCGAILRARSFGNIPE